MDRDELFGEGKASSTVAKVTQGDAIKGLTVNFNYKTKSSKLIIFRFREVPLARKARYSVPRCWLAREGTS